MARTLLGLLLGLLSVSCAAEGEFHCLEDEQCGEGGICEPNSTCSFEDESCPSSRRFGEYAPPNISNQCVPVGGVETSMGGESEDDVAPSGTSVCAQMDSCEKCLECTLYDGPCASAALPCASSNSCFERVACMQTCTITGICLDCCDKLSEEELATINSVNECMMSECEALCGAGFDPLCGG